MSDTGPDYGVDADNALGFLDYGELRRVDADGKLVPIFTQEEIDKLAIGIYEAPGPQTPREVTAKQRKAMVAEAERLGADRILFDPTNWEVLTAAAEVAGVPWTVSAAALTEFEREVVSAYERGARTAEAAEV